METGVRNYYSLFGDTIIVNIRVHVMYIGGIKYDIWSRELDNGVAKYHMHTGETVVMSNNSMSIYDSSNVLQNVYIGKIKDDNFVTITARDNNNKQYLLSSFSGFSVKKIGDNLFDNNPGKIIRSISRFPKCITYGISRTEYWSFIVNNSGRLDSIVSSEFGTLTVINGS